MTCIWMVVLVVGAAAYAGLLVTALCGIFKLRASATTRVGTDSSSPRSVSIIIAAKDEEAEIGRTLESLLVQNYGEGTARDGCPTGPTEATARDGCRTGGDEGTARDGCPTEVIVVADRCKDKTSEIVNSYASRDGRIRLIEQQELLPGYSPKKSALMRGIETATGEIIVTTDADCRHDPGWLSSLVERMPDNGGMVIGQARFDIGDHPPLWQRLQALDFTSQEILSVGLTTAKFPFNCSGASLAFSRKAFDLVGGWSGYEGFTSGDDELLMAKFVKAGFPVVASPEPASVVKTRPPASLGELWHQRVRWGSKSLHYATSRKALLIGVFLFYIALTLSPFVAIFGGKTIALVLAWELKIALDALLLGASYKLYRDRIGLLYFIIAEVLHPPVIIAMTVAGAFGSFKWKGSSYTAQAMR